MNLTTVHHFGKHMFTIPAMGSLKKIVEQDLGENQIGLMGHKNPIIFYFLVKLQNISVKRYSQICPMPST